MAVAASTGDETGAVKVTACVGDQFFVGCLQIIAALKRVDDVLFIGLPTLGQLEDDAAAAHEAKFATAAPADLGRTDDRAIRRNVNATAARRNAAVRGSAGKAVEHALLPFGRQRKDGPASGRASGRAAAAVVGRPIQDAFLIGNHARLQVLAVLRSTGEVVDDLVTRTFGRESGDRAASGVTVLRAASAAAVLR